MLSVKTNSESVPYVETCLNCGWVDGLALNWWADNFLKTQLSARAARIAVATETEPFAFAQSSDSELTLEEVLFQALGAASVCWEKKGLLQAGIFNSTRAKEIGLALLAEVQRFRRLALEDAATRAVQFLNRPVDPEEYVEPGDYYISLRKVIEEGP